MNRTTAASFAVALSLAAALAAALPTCRHDMVRGVFTPCDKSHNRMFAVQYFNETCTPADGVALQPPRPARCDEPCQSGQWFSPISNLCENCAPGTSSNSGGHIIRDFTDGVPPRFVTHCQPEPCSAWAPGPAGGMLTSGNQSGLRTETRAGWPIDETVTSDLVTIVNVINPHGGKFIFDYRVESEHYYDGLKVLLNGTQYYTPEEPNTHDYRSRFLLSGVHLSWRHIEIPLPPLASTEVTLVFSKDRDQSSLHDSSMAGLDRAFVRDVVIEGVQMFAPECTPCPAGTHSAARALTCAPCPANSFADPGSSTCQRCSEHQWSPPGSRQCIDRLPCREDDFVATYTRCFTDNNTRFRSWRIARSSRCDPTLPGSVAAKATENVACRPCNKGWALNDATGQCDKCPLVGQMRDLTTNACSFCPEGLAAVPAVHFDDGFDEFGSEINTRFFESQCKGECGQSCENGVSCTANNSGFGLVSLPSLTADDDNTSVAIQSQSGNGGTYESTLRYRFTSRSSGFYHFKFYFAHTGRGRVQENDAVSAVLRFDNGSQVTELNNRATSTSRGTHYGMYHDIGDHEIEIVVSQSLPTPPADESLFTLTSLVVSGDIRGAAHQCEMCQPGTYCPEHSAGMLPCPVGTANSGYHAHQCTTCSMGQYADDEGLRNCKMCPAGTMSSADRSQCESTCDIRYDGVHFDLSTLADTYFGPISASEAPPSSFYMNLCHFVNRNGSSSVCEARNGVALRRSYACQHYTASRSYSLGAEPSFGLDATGALTFAAEGGDDCQHGGMSRSTNVTLVCDPAAPVPGQLEYVEENPHCHYRFSLRTQAACALCTEHSFTKTVGECTRDGTQEVTYGKRPGIQCSRGFVPPPPRNLSCDRCLPNYLEPSWSQCDQGIQHVIFTVQAAHMGCTDDGSADAEMRAQYVAQKIPLNKTCHQIEVAVGANTFTFGLAIILIILLALCAVIVIAFLEYDKLHNTYSTLQAANAEVGTGETELREVPRHVQERVERENASRATTSGATAVPVTSVANAPSAAGRTEGAGDDDDNDSLPEDGGEPVPAAAAEKP